MTEMEKALVDVLEANTAIEKRAASLSQPIKAAPMPPMAQPLHAQGEQVHHLPGKRSQSLVEQMSQLERIERELLAKLRREQVEAQVGMELRITEAHARYARELSEATARFSRERDDEIRQASDDYHIKVNELMGLLRRRP